MTLQTNGTDSTQLSPTNHDISRRSVLIGGAAFSALLACPEFALALASQQAISNRDKAKGVIKQNRLKTKDGTEIFFKDWGAGTPIVFSHGWPLSSDAWDAQMLFFGQRGFRVIAHDRRGHGRSDHAKGGNDMDTYANDLAELINALDLKEVVLVGHSTGGGEVVRYIGKHGNSHLSRLVLISALPPLRLKTARNPGGAPLSAYDEVRSNVAHDRSQFFRDLSEPFFGKNKGVRISQGVEDNLWRMGVQTSVDATFYGIKTQSETDFTGDLRKIKVPTMFLHGAEDQLVPVDNSARLSVTLVKNASLKVYPGAPHGMTITHADEVNADMLSFIQA